MRNNKGQFIKGCKINLGRKRLDMVGNNFASGKPSWNKGIPMSEEAKEKSRKSHRGKPNLRNRKLNPITPINKLIRRGIEMRLW